MRIAHFLVFCVADATTIADARYKSEAEAQLMKCAKSKGPLLKCICGTPEKASEKCFTTNQTSQIDTLRGRPNTCLASNYHCSMCRKVINWMALKDECSGVAGRTSNCVQKANEARSCPDLSDNFDSCWSRLQAHQSDNGILLKSSKLDNLHAASRFAQNEFKLCILDPATNELCFKAANNAKNTLRDNQDDSSWLGLLSKFQVDDQTVTLKTLDAFFGYIYDDNEVNLLEDIALKLRPARGRKWRKKKRKTKTGGETGLFGRSQMVPLAHSGGFSFDTSAFDVSANVFHAEFDPFNNSQ